MLRSLIVSFVVVFFGVSGTVWGDEKKTEREPEKRDEYAWRQLFDGKTLKGWTVPRFGGDGEVKVEEGCLVIGQGAMMTGVKYDVENNNVFPRLDYEIRYEAQRTQGSDFFAALTFPYKDSACTFINGGWGGGTIGLSCIGNLDASENETGAFHAFKDNRWYKFRVRVTAAKIDVWVHEQVKDGDKTGKGKEETQIIELEVADKELSLRDETELYKPLGFCTWTTEGRVRNIEYRKLRPEEVDGKPTR